MAASLLIPPTTKVYNFTLAATGATASFALPIAEGYYAELVVPASAGTVDVALQHSVDNGVTYTTLPLKFAQSAAASGNVVSGLGFKPAIGLSDPAFATSPIVTGAAVAANIPFNTRNVRFYVTLGTAGTTTISVRFTMAQKGVVAQ